MEIREPLRNKEQTGQRMRAVIQRFARDLDTVTVRRNRRDVPFAKLSLRSAHSLVKKIPYKRDTEPVEVLARPSRLLSGEFRTGIDCKKKAVLLGAWAVRNNVPYRLVASSRRPDRRYHHVFPQFYLRGSWVNVDATYSNMKLGENKTCTACEVI
jgi:hypothetical protein